jgi:hypothetical protein
MYLPNPTMFGLIKATAYSVFASMVRLRAMKPGHWIVTPIAFGILRAIAGVLVGTPVVILTSASLLEPTDAQLVIVLIIPRLLLSMVLVQMIFAPRGGWRESALWALISVALASAIDLLLLLNYENVDWLRIIWC